MFTITPDRRYAIVSYRARELAGKLDQPSMNEIAEVSQAEARELGERVVCGSCELTVAGEVISPADGTPGCTVTVGCVRGSIGCPLVTGFALGRTIERLTSGTE